jgi:5'(3')-deoxyribonucleotidase
MATPTDAGDDQNLRLIQIIYGLVIAQSLVFYRSNLLHPLTPEHQVGTLALVVVLVTTILSWVDFHRTIAVTPYVISEPWEVARLGSDLLVVLVYAYLLFSIEPFAEKPSGSLAPHLLGYLLLFSMYWLSGQLRVMKYGYIASRRLLIAEYALVFGSIYFLYTRLAPSLALRESSLPLLNKLTLTVVLCAMIGYRYDRSVIRRHARLTKSKGLRVGIDVDGVLGDQITGVLPRIKRKYGVELGYSDIVDWKLPIKDSDIAREIEDAHSDGAYVLGMPIHPYAREAVEVIGKRNTIVIITARLASSDAMTRQWLAERRIIFDEYVNSRENGKGVHRLDVLIDDYPGNISAFLSNGGRLAILMEQPWNEDRSELAVFGERLRVVRGWREVPPIIEELRTGIDRE